MTAALTRSAPARWDVAAVALAGLGVVTATWLIVSSDSDPAGVLWPLVVAPIAICLVPVLAPRRGARIGAAVAMGGWCILTGFSIGFLLLPAFFALLGAVVRETT